MTEKKYYKVNPEKKTITIDDSVKPTKQDEADLMRYLGAGYILRHKSAARSATAKSRSGGLTKADIEKALANEPKFLEKFTKLCKGKGKGQGVFAAKSWYEKDYQREKEEAREKAEAEKKAAEAENPAAEN